MNKLLLPFLLVITVHGFAPPIRPHVIAGVSTTRRYGFMPEPEREKLTRDSEPEEFFSTNTDKMTDKEKIPIAIAGVAFIALPFIAGLIALYSAK